MAHLRPSIPSRSALNCGVHAELELLHTLERGLSDAYTLFHGVDFRPDGIFKHYGVWSRDVTAQARLQYSGLLSRLHGAGFDVPLRHLLVLPDVRVLSEAVQWPTEPIVDSVDIDNIVSRITQTQGTGARNDKAFERLMAFFENRFLVEP